MKVGTLAPPCLQNFFDPFNFGRRLIRREIKADPAVAVFTDAPERRRRLSAEPDWDGAVVRLGKALDFGEAHEFPTMGAFWFGPQLAHHVDILTSALSTAVEGNSQSLKFFR